MITGQYNELEYTVFSDDEPLYTAGNHPGDSEVFVSAEAEVGRRTMRLYCLDTMRQYAEERNEQLGAAEYFAPKS